MMATAAASPILQLIRRVVEDPQERDLPDRELLQRFHAQNDQAAFHTLLRRHGPMVLDVCRGVLGDGPDADDAFQATFLVLAQKAGSIRKGASLGSWLHGVAHRTALKARAQSAVRHKHEARAQQRQTSAADDLTWREVRQVLHEELGGISERYREPLVMCYLQGATQQRAAARLGLTERTVRKRLERGRELLRLRLVRRGLGPVAVLAVAVWPTATVSAAVPAVLVDSTVKAATSVAAGGAAASLVSARVAALTQGVLRTMFFSKLKVTAAALLVAALSVGGVLIPSLCGLPQPSLAQQPAVKQQEKPPDKEPASKQGSVKITKPGKWVNSLAYCNDGKTVAIVLWHGAPRAPTQAGSVVLWDLEKGKVKQTLEEFEKLDVDTLQFWHVAASKNGTTIAASASVGKDKKGVIRVWEAKTGNVLHTFEFSALVHGAVALSADGKKVAGGDWFTENGEVCVWDVPSGNLLQKLSTPRMENLSLAFSEDGKWIAAGGRAGEDGPNRNNKVMVWNLETGKVKHEWTDPNGVGAVTALAFSPDAKLVAAGGLNEGSIRMWDMQTGKLKHVLNGHEIRSLAFSPDGKTLASNGLDGKIILWDVAMEKVRATLSGHDKDDKGGGRWVRVLSMAFSPDGRTLASGGTDGTMRFWQLAPTKEPRK
jgi:RNA polymerase sigma factor (sigma-70 family)